VTEEAVVEAVTVQGARSVHDLRQLTGAGDGCTACHKRLALYLHAYSSSEEPICSVK
jgi:bacterioferritin-associated ferredoxin